MTFKEDKSMVQVATVENHKSVTFKEDKCMVQVATGKDHESIPPYPEKKFSAVRLFKIRGFLEKEQNVHPPPCAF